MCLFKYLFISGNYIYDRDYRYGGNFFCIPHFGLAARSRGKNDALSALSVSPQQTTKVSHCICYFLFCGITNKWKLENAKVKYSLQVGQFFKQNLRSPCRFDNSTIPPIQYIIPERASSNSSSLASSHAFPLTSGLYAPSRFLIG